MEQGLTPKEKKHQHQKSDQHLTNQNAGSVFFRARGQHGMKNREVTKGIEHDKKRDGGGQNQVHERAIAIFCLEKSFDCEFLLFSAYEIIFSRCPTQNPTCGGCACLGGVCVDVLFDGCLGYATGFFYGDGVGLDPDCDQLF